MSIGHKAAKQKIFNIKFENNLISISEKDLTYLNWRLFSKHRDTNDREVVISIVRQGKLFKSLLKWQKEQKSEFNYYEKVKSRSKLRSKEERRASNKKYADSHKEERKARNKK